MVRCGENRAGPASAVRYAGLAFDLLYNGQMSFLPLNSIASTIWVLVGVPIWEWLRFNAPGGDSRTGQWRTPPQLDARVYAEAARPIITRPVRRFDKDEYFTKKVRKIAILNHSFY
jgi:hypothetical protein